MLVFAGLSLAADIESAKQAYQTKDYGTAYKEASPLAAQGNAEAELLLGKMYLMGQGVLKDSDEAVKWLKKSAMQGNAEAQFFLGSFYMLPRRDFAEGVKWMRLSAEQGNKDAQYLLGKAYLQGDKDFPPDPVQAEKWLLLASQSNLEFYQRELLGAEKQMSTSQIEKGKALAQAWKPKSDLRPE
jgi:TPR repeat protein